MSQQKIKQVGLLSIHSPYTWTIVVHRINMKVISAIFLVLILAACDISVNESIVDFEEQDSQTAIAPLPCILGDTTHLSVIQHNAHESGTIPAKEVLIEDSIITSDHHSIDIYFAGEISRNGIRVPYYLPAGGLYKDSIKEEQEDEWEDYEPSDPRYMYRYAYDSLGRVIEMHIQGSGTMYSGKFLYDEKNRLTEIIGTENIRIKYCSDTHISSVVAYSKTSGKENEEHRLEFIYK